MIQKRGQGQVHGRSTVADLLAPNEGYRGQMKRLGKAIKDHVRDNKIDIKSAERRNRERKEEEDSKPAHEPFKLAQFRDVESRVYDNKVPEDENRTKNDHFLMKNQSKKRFDDLMIERRQQRLTLQQEMENLKLQQQDPPTPKKTPIPPAQEVGRLLPRSQKDYISSNKVKALTMAPPDSKPPQPPSKHEAYGRVPEYLEARKAAWAEEEAERRRLAPDPNCPPGMCLMDEQERQSTLESLIASKAEAMRLYGRLPLATETTSQKKRQEQLETKIKEIERAIGLFSRPKVYIAQEH